MLLARLSLADFRNYQSLEIELQPGITTFVGANGQGKTNLIEAVNYVATLGSHRVASDNPLVRAGSTQAIVRAELKRDLQSTLVEIEINPGRANRVRINRSPVPRPREVLGLLRAVIFAPEDLSLVKGDPSERRRFLDDLLVSRNPRFAAVRADYDRVLRQRNSLLKSVQGSRPGNTPTTLSVWDDHLLDLGAELISGRLNLISSLKPYVVAAYETVAGVGSDVDMNYVAAASGISATNSERADVRVALAQALSERQREELARGLTLVGPHRDEMFLGLRGLPVRGYASHGESWSCALALRLGAFDLLRSEGLEDEPMLILDDVFAELDTRRRDRLAQVAAAARQVLVTAAVAADVPAGMGGVTLKVSEGQVDVL
ncbi:MAG: DNA replication/repair protein RecF [Actinomycetes bacterium]